MATMRKLSQIFYHCASANCLATAHHWRTIWM